MALFCKMFNLHTLIIKIKLYHLRMPHIVLKNMQKTEQTVTAKTAMLLQF